MSRMIFVNLPVADVQRATAFYDMRFLYARAFEDLHGHTYEPVFMDMAAATRAMAAPHAAVGPAAA